MPLPTPLPTYEYGARHNWFRIYEVVYSRTLAPSHTLSTPPYLVAYGHRSLLCQEVAVFTSALQKSCRKIDVSNHPHHHHYGHHSAMGHTNVLHGIIFII